MMTAARGSGPMNAATQLVFVTGLSGSGKSLVGKVLEDVGYYVLDNLPSPLIPKFVELLGQSGEEIARAALIVDLRDRTFTRHFPDLFAEARASGPDVRLLYFEASEEALLRRFSETRRMHPLQIAGGSVGEALLREREALAPIRALADLVVDTTGLTTRDLRERVVAWLGSGRELPPPTLTLMTFGFKYGPPRETDWILDVRFLPNPFFVPGLKELSGRDQAVREFIRAQPIAGSFVTRVCDILREVLPLYAREGRSGLTVAVGCTGGRHRSVAIAREIEESLAASRGAGGEDGQGAGHEAIRIIAVDRDIEKG